MGDLGVNKGEVSTLFNVEFGCVLIICSVKLTGWLWFFVHSRHVTKVQSIILDTNADKAKQLESEGNIYHSDALTDRFRKLDRQTTLIVSGKPDRDEQNILRSMLPLSTLWVMMAGVSYDSVLSIAVLIAMWQERINPLKDTPEQRNVSDILLDWHVWARVWVCFTIGVYKARMVYDVIVKEQLIEDAMSDESVEIKDWMATRPRNWIKRWTHTIVRELGKRKLSVNEWRAVTTSALFVPLLFVIQPHLSLTAACVLNSVVSLLSLSTGIVTYSAQLTDPITLPMTSLGMVTETIYLLGSLILIFVIPNCRSNPLTFSVVSLMDSTGSVFEFSLYFLGPRYVIRDQIARLTWLEWFKKWSERLSPIVRKQKKEEVSLSTINVSLGEWLFNNNSSISSIESKEKAFLFAVSSLNQAADFLFVLDCRALIKNLESMVCDDCVAKYLRKLSISKHMNHDDKKAGMKKHVEKQNGKCPSDGCDIEMINNRASELSAYWLLQSRVQPFMCGVPTHWDSHPLYCLDLAYSLSFQHLEACFERSLRYSHRLCLVHSLCHLS